MKSTAICFPFDLFGSAGTARGAEAVLDALREILDDNRTETVPTRADAYRSKVQLREFAFETLDSYQDWRHQARQAVRSALGKDRFLVWLTGNHLGALPLYEELGNRQNTVVVQFDAHLDIQNFAACTKEPSHGNFLLHAEGALPPVINVGHRDLLLPREYVQKFYRRTISAIELTEQFGAILDEIRTVCGAAQSVFLDLDCDVFDPAVFPAVTHPVPFGLQPTALLGVIDAVWSDRVAGISISEFDPGRDRNDACLATLTWLVEHILIKRHE